MNNKELEEKYKPLLENAEAEIRKAEAKTTVKEKTTHLVNVFKWFLAMMKVMVTNDLHTIHADSVSLREEMRKRTNKILMFLWLVLLITLATNQRLIDFICALFKIGVT